MAWTARAPEVEDTSQESLLGTGLRTAARTAARVVETVAGLPGDIAAGVLQVSDIAGKKLGQLTGNERLKKSDTSRLRNVLPTSGNIQKYVTKNVEKILPEDYLTPQTESEERLDNFTETLASLLSTGGTAKQGASFVNKAAKAAGLAGGAELGKWATEKITGSPALGSGVKLGTILLGSTAGGRKQLENKANSLYENVGNIIGENSPNIDVTNTLYKSTKDIIKGLGGIQSPSKKLVKDLAGDVLNATGGKRLMSLKDIVDADQVLNEILRTNYDTLSANKASLRKMYEIKDGIESAIKSTEKLFPDFYRSYTDAKDIWRGLNASDFIRQGLESVAKGEHFKSPLTTYFILKSPAKLGTYGLAAAGANVLKSPYNFYKSLSSPYIRNHYKNMVKSASTGKFGIALKELHKLDDAFAQEFPEQESTGGWTQRL